MDNRVRVWLNRTYAENVFFIEQLRHNPQRRAVHVHASHTDPDSPVLMAADEATLEPEGLTPSAYVEYALDHCARHGIDVFVPRLNQAAVAAHRADFAETGTTVLSPPAGAISVFEDKIPAYEALAAAGFPVPRWWRVSTEEELLAAVGEIESEGGKACLKPASGAGGEGFRIITRQPFSMLHLTGYVSPYVPLDLVLQALRGAREPVQWIVMPYLSSPEVSVDCLTGPDGRVRLAVARTKNGRRRGFSLDPAWLEPARGVAEHFGLHYLTNIQFRMLGERPVLLDINTRAAGGLHQLSLCGVNAPWAALRLALGEETGDLTPDFLGPDYAVVASPCPVRPVGAARRRHASATGAAPAQGSCPGPVHGAAPAHTPVTAHTSITAHTSVTAHAPASAHGAAPVLAAGPVRGTGPAPAPLGALEKAQAEPELTV
ncbi:ATP-grasp domain-containing protein [Streptomyces sp. GC420]|uniref:ATP-grasp domain-containing protein n=1 Tax=Streptomyces sp. GC420 TaxID=2697568 RepID=UPI001415024B|nr:ATP-grasp domain-containing protein [Streptomyces sp. GC420]NBM16236.1 ATP-grasp domain protein [Streptomyces sp. GC420]